MLYRRPVCRRFVPAKNGIQRLLALAFLMNAVTFSAHAQSARTGSIQGVITDSKQNAVIGAKVWAIRVFSPAAVAGPMVTSTDTDEKGAYQISGLARASYRICVYAENVMLLDPCTWSNQPPLWNLESGQAATLNIALATGQFVHVRVDDPKGTITSAEQKTGALAISMSGVSADGHGTNFVQISNDSAGRNFRALVPNGATVSLQIGSLLNVVNQSGGSVVATPTPPTVQGSAVEQTVRLIVP